MKFKNPALSLFLELIRSIISASAIMDAYNLLSLVIVDESTEVARFLYDVPPIDLVQIHLN